ncbi:Surfeit locus protein 1-like protein [Aphelenchoides bicaudatus]|nr:Surfeit locus protein 1-like protein [Aphelenchoides bicaudatus]
MKLLSIGRLIEPCSSSARCFSTQRVLFSPANEDVIQLNTKEKTERFEKTRKVTAGSVVLLVVPIATFCLGVWQVQRYKLRKSLIADLDSKYKSSDPNFPSNERNILEEKSMKNISYLLTWFGISGVTTIMWWSQFMKKR